MFVFVEPVCNSCQCFAGLHAPTQAFICPQAEICFASSGIRIGLRSMKRPLSREELQTYDCATPDCGLNSQTTVKLEQELQMILWCQNRD